MRVLKSAAAISVALFAASALPASAEGRGEFVSWQAMVAGAAQAAPTRPDEAALARCRQIIRDWTLRESRMSVDENGKPIR